MAGSKYRRGTRFTAEIADLAFKGRGVANIEGMIAFVDGGLPGDTVLFEILRRKRRHLEGRVVEILTPSSDRVEPRCSHFGFCGGCRLQDLAYEKQIGFKAAQVREQIVRIGNLDDPGEIPIIPCEPTFGYRNKMEFTFGTDREGTSGLGLHPRGEFRDVFDLTECYLPSPSFAKIVEATRRHFDGLTYEPYHPIEHTGFLRFLVVREGRNTGEILVNLVTAEGIVDNPEQWVAAIRKAAPEIVTVVHTINSLRANVAVGELQDVWYGDGTFTEILAGLKFTLGPLSFFQTNTRQAEILFATAMEYTALTKDDRVLDLYSGAGAISLQAARRAGSVTGVELVPEAVRAATEAATQNGIENCEFVCADSLESMKAEVAAGHTYDIVLVDPPRAGLHPKVIKRLAEMAPDRIVYVSCNPGTLARDLGLLAEHSYALEKITAVDMFPHTAHIEAVALLRRQGKND